MRNGYHKQWRQPLEPLLSSILDPNCQSLSNLPQVLDTLGFFSTAVAISNADQVLVSLNVSSYSCTHTHTETTSFFLLKHANLL